MDTARVEMPTDSMEQGKISDDHADLMQTHEELFEAIDEAIGRIRFQQQVLYNSKPC